MASGDRWTFDNPLISVLPNGQIVRSFANMYETNKSVATRHKEKVSRYMRIYRYVERIQDGCESCAKK